MFGMLKVKPPHGWNAVGWELAIVTVGVLVALGAQQTVEMIHERSEVEQLRGALRAELADDRGRWERIRDQDRCAEQRLGALEKWVASAPAGASLPANPYLFVLLNMHSSAWDLAKTSSATTQIPLKERLTYANLYGAIDNWRQFINEENANSQMLSGLLATADQPENRGQVRLRLSMARGFVNRRKLNYGYFFRRFDELGIKPDTSQMTIRVDPMALCEPLDRLS